MLGWMKHKLDSRLLGEILTTSAMQMIPPNGRKWKGTKEPLDKGERGDWKSQLKTQHSKNQDHGIQSYHFMANGETMETVANFILLGSKINPKGNQPWIFIVKTDAEAEAPILWPPGVKNWLTGKDPEAGKDWRQREKGMTGDEMVGWLHRFNGHEFEWTPGVGDGQGSLACCSLWGFKEFDTTEQLN